MSDSSSAFFASKPEERSIEENWNMFKTSLTAGMCQFIPQKSSRPKFKLPWIDTIKREMRKKDRLHKKATRSKNNQHWKAFKHQCNLVSKLVKEAHNHYLNDVIGNSLRPIPNVVLLPCRTQMNLARQWHDDSTSAVSNVEPNTVAPYVMYTTNRITLSGCLHTPHSLCPLTYFAPALELFAVQSSEEILPKWDVGSFC